MSSATPSGAVAASADLRWSCCTAPGHTALFRRYPVRRGAAGFHHHLDCVFHPVLGVANRRGQIFEREGVGVNPGCVEALLGHESLGTVGRALALATDAVNVDVVAHDVSDINGR